MLEHFPNNSFAIPAKETMIAKVGLKDTAKYGQFSKDLPGRNFMK
jgi:hypothetical protein